MSVKTPQVFLDANIVIAAGKPPGGPEISRVADLVEAGMITVITTDLSVTEIAKKHAENDFQLVKDFARSHVRRALESVLQIEVPEVTRDVMRDRLLSQYSESTAKMLGRLKAKTLSINDVEPSIVFNAYARGEGFFFGDAKKDQFPDAFIFERLKAEASTAHPVIIVTNDGDYARPSADTDNVELVTSLPELFTSLGLEFEPPEVNAFLEENIEVLAAHVNEELETWGLAGDVEDSEIEDVVVTGLGIIRMIAFKPLDAEDPIILMGELEATAEISYSHPDWDSASYDSDDKVLIPWDTVTGETEVTLPIDVSISIEVDKDTGELLKIEEISFRNERFQYVVLHPPEDWR